MAHCPLELNLMPKSSIQKQEIRRKQPFFIATVLCVVLVIFAYGYLFRRLASVKAMELAKIQEKAGPYKRTDAQLQAGLKRLKLATAEADALLGWVDDRNRWPELISELRRIMIQTEQLSRKATFEAGLWIESMGPVSVTEQVVGATPKVASDDCAPNDCSGASDDCAPAMAAPAPAGSRLAQVAPASTGTNEVAAIKLVCRAVNMMKAAPSANSDLAFTFARELQKSPLFDPEGTQLSGTLEQVQEKDVTFSFGVNLRLKRPIKR
jgi:hypothetical protein